MTAQLTSKTLGDLETWIASPEGQRYSCTRQYPHPGYACDYHGATCAGCLIVAAARELRNKSPENETYEQATLNNVRKWADDWSKRPARDASEADRGWYWAALEVQKLVNANAQKADEQCGHGNKPDECPHPHTDVR